MRLTTPRERQNAAREARIQRKCEQHRITRAYMAYLVARLKAMKTEKAQ